MIVGKENEKLEFKKTIGELKEGIISIVAILNKHGAGELYFGIRNDGEPLGFEITDKTMRDISQAVQNHIEPKVYPKISEVYIDGKSCVHVEFAGEQMPYYGYGRAYIRVADEDRVMSPAELESYILKKNAGRDAWDGEMSGKTVSDVDEMTLMKFVDDANKAGRINFEYTDKRSVLNRLQATDGDVINNAARALFIGFPLLEVQMAMFATKEKLTFLDIRRSGGNVRDLIETTVKYCIEKMNWRVVFDGSIQRKEVPEIPVEALREAVTNSFCHRDYRSSQNNEIAIYSDRISIYNPGQFPIGLEPEDFISETEHSVKRNPNLAQLMYYCKDIESFGTGFKRIVNACKDAGVKYEFKKKPLGFEVIFYRPNNTEKPDTVIRTNYDQINDQIKAYITASEQTVLSIIGSDPYLTIDEIADKMGKSAKTAQRYLNSLRKKSIIQRAGSRKDGHWEVID